MLMLCWQHLRVDDGHCIEPPEPCTLSVTPLGTPALVCRWALLFAVMSLNLSSPSSFWQHLRVDDGDLRRRIAFSPLNPAPCSIFVSMMEIYGDEVLDLLSPVKKKIIPREDAKKKVPPTL